MGRRHRHGRVSVAPAGGRAEQWAARGAQLARSLPDRRHVAPVVQDPTLGGGHPVGVPLAEVVVGGVVLADQVVQPDVAPGVVVGERDHGLLGAGGRAQRRAMEENASSTRPTESWMRTSTMDGWRSPLRPLRRPRRAATTPTASPAVPRRGRAGRSGSWSGSSCASFLLTTLVGGDEGESISYEDFIQQAGEGQVASITFDNTNAKITGELEDGTEFTTTGPAAQRHPRRGPHHPPGQRRRDHLRDPVPQLRSGACSPSPCRSS